MLRQSRLAAIHCSMIRTVVRWVPPTARLLVDNGHKIELVIIPMTNCPWKRRCQRDVTFLKMLVPHHIFQTGEAMHLKFEKGIRPGKWQSKHDKLPQNGHCQHQVTHFRPHAILHMYTRPTVSLLVCQSVCHSRKPCKNSWTDRDGVWVENSGRNHVLDGVQIPRGKEQV